MGNWIKIGVPIIIVSLIISITVVSTVNAQGKYSIPAWVKGVAGFWAEDKITDDDFGEGLSFLIEEDIIKVPKIQSLQNEIARLKSENKNLKGDVAFLENENTDLRRQLTDLNKPIQTTPSQSYEPKTTEQKSSLSYPKITKRYDGDTAVEKLKELISFHSSLTSSQRLELASRSVPQSEFVIGVVFGGEFNLAFMEGNYEMTEITGRGVVTVIPFDCSRNVEYIYSIVAQKEVESGKITLYVFKNGVGIDKESSDKPYGMAIAAGQCDEPTVVR